MRRRQFLAGLGLTASLAGCTAAVPGTPRTASGSLAGSSGAGPSPSPTQPGETSGPTMSSGGSPAAPSPTPTVVRPPASIAQLRRDLNGALVGIGDRGYATARLGYDSNYDAQRPAAIAQCHSVSDVQRCVEFAAATRTPIAARSGGHSYAGYSTPEAGLVVDLGAMSRVHVNAGGAARVDAGARLIEVYTALADAGRCLPAGSCPTVGIAGLTLGGGVGFLTRIYGLTCDRLIAAEVVTADAVVHQVSAGQDADLFWALRGGGGGNVGIVTSFTFQTEAAPPLIKFALDFSDGTVVDVFGAWQQWIADAPDTISAGCAIDATDQPSCVVAGLGIGSLAAVRSQLALLVRMAGVSPNAQVITPIGLEQAMYQIADCAGLTEMQCSPNWTGNGQGQLPRNSFVGTSRILRQAVDAQALTDAVAGADVSVLIEPINGAAARLAANATAFPFRDALATAQIYCDGTNRSVIDDVRTSLGNLMGPYGYVNYIDPSMPDWPRAYYAGNRAQLENVARTYDPDKVFRFAQSINR